MSHSMPRAYPVKTNLWLARNCLTDCVSLLFEFLMMWPKTRTKEKTTKKFDNFAPKQLMVCSQEQKCLPSSNTKYCKEVEIKCSISRRMLYVEERNNATNINTTITTVNATLLQIYLITHNINCISLLTDHLFSDNFSLLRSSSVGLSMKNIIYNRTQRIARTVKLTESRIKLTMHKVINLPAQNFCISWTQWPTIVEGHKTKDGSGANIGWKYTTESNRQGISTKHSKQDHI